MIYIGADHRGYKLKKKMKGWLEEWNHDFRDEGAYKLDTKDDYTLYAEKVAVLVAADKTSKGILICGSGVGVDVVANKIDGVRSSIGKSAKQVKSGRDDDDMNVLVVAADFTAEKESREMLKAFIDTKFSGKKRYKRRIEEIKRIEANN